MKKYGLLFLMVFLLVSQSLPILVKANHVDPSKVIELNDENGITHHPNEIGFMTMVDRDKLPETVRDFVKISCGSSNMPFLVTKENIENFIGGYSVYDDRGYGSSLPQAGKYYNLTMLYDQNNIPLAYYLSSVEYKGKNKEDEKEESEIESIVLSEESLTILTGKTAKIHAYAIDSEGNEKEITNDTKTMYRSSSESIVSVKKGVITAKSKEGKATITVSYKGKKAELPVTVSKTGVVKLTSSVKELNLETGETADVSLIATLSDKKTKDVSSIATWYTDDSEVATVDKGEIEGISDGEATITAFYQGNEISFKVFVTTVEEETKEVEALQIQDKNVKLLINEEKVLKVMAVYDDGTKEDFTDQVTWTSSKNSVVEVEDGVLLANGLGVATITASYNDVEATLKVEVKKDKPLKSLIASSKKVSLKRGQEFEITLTAYYTDGTKRVVSDLADWKVTKSGIVTVEDGVITAGNKKGSTTITAKYNGKSVNIPVTVQ